MAKGNLEERIETLTELSRQPFTEQTAAALRKALTDRSNLIVAQAAKLIGQLSVGSLAPDLLGAFDRMLQKGAAGDPKCWGKKAIVDALTTMDHDDSAVFLKGLRHVQMEPVWGGQEDTATSLRGRCALALLQCGDITRHAKLRHLVDAMADPAEPVRVDAARAIEQMEGDESALLLRMKARMGDSSPRVTGQVMESLISIEREQGIRFVSEFLESRDDAICEEAALALGASRMPAGFLVLKDAWLRQQGQSRSRMFLRAISASGLPEAIDFLLGLIMSGLQRDADHAVEALELHSRSEDIQGRLRDALKGRIR